MLNYLTIFPGHFNLDIVQSRAGVHKSATSGYESFEAPDPAEWTARGYAIVNVNARGIMGSTGDTRYVLRSLLTIMEVLLTHHDPGGLAQPKDATASMPSSTLPPWTGVLERRLWWEIPGSPWRSG